MLLYLCEVETTTPGTKRLNEWDPSFGPIFISTQISVTVQAKGSAFYPSLRWSAAHDFLFDGKCITGSTFVPIHPHKEFLHLLHLHVS